MNFINLAAIFATLKKKKSSKSEPFVPSTVVEVLEEALRFLKEDRTTFCCHAIMFQPLTSNELKKETMNFMFSQAPSAEINRDLYENEYFILNGPPACNSVWWGFEPKGQEMDKKHETKFKEMQEQRILFIKRLIDTKEDIHIFNN
jgi:hypothetical protein